MTVLCKAQPQAILAFDSLAAKYDDLFTRSMVGRAQRGAVWEVFTKVFTSGSHLLELNCGTGEDALFLAGRNMSVVACDASERMIERARTRMQAEAPEAPIEFQLLPTEQLAELRPRPLFDGAFSNFSGLNCVADLNQTAHNLATLLAPRAPILICLSTRFCLFEMLWFLLHADPRKAFRRSSGTATATVGEFGVKVRYPTLREVRRLFSPYFRLRACTAIGVTVPPSYLEPVIRKCPGVLSLLRRIDRGICRLPWFRTIGDHMLLHFERAEGLC